MLGNYEINNVLIVGPTTILHYLRIFVGTQQLISFFDSADIRLDECLSKTWFYFSTYHFTIVGFPKHLAPSIYIIHISNFWRRISYRNYMVHQKMGLGTRFGRGKHAESKYPSKFAVRAAIDCEHRVIYWEVKDFIKMVYWFKISKHCTVTHSGGPFKMSILCFRFKFSHKSS